jgi:hypothetical protein
MASFNAMIMCINQPGHQETAFHINPLSVGAYFFLYFFVITNSRNDFSCDGNDISKWLLSIYCSASIALSSMLAAGLVM